MNPTITDTQNKGSPSAEAGFCFPFLPPVGQCCHARAFSQSFDKQGSHLLQLRALAGGP